MNKLEEIKKIVDKYYDVDVDFKDNEIIDDFKNCINDLVMIKRIIDE